MADKPAAQGPPEADAVPADPVVVPGVTAQPHPPTNVTGVPIVPGPQNGSNLPGGASPLGGYVREIQREYDEQQEEGKL
jgi:hypothetical protein